MGTHVVAIGPSSPSHGPPKSFKILLFVGGSMAFGVCRNCLRTYRSKMENFCKTFF